MTNDLYKGNALHGAQTIFQLRSEIVRHLDQLWIALFKLRDGI
jgi:hypothetical protein